MARYILINLDTQKVLGKLQDDGGQRPFVDIAEAYEELVKLAGCAAASEDKIGDTFRRWVLHEVSRVEGN